MTAMPNEQFAREVMRIAGAAEPFAPHAAYDRDGDCIEFIFRPDPFYAERVDDLLTVYYSQQDGQLIGSLIKGVSRLCQRILKTRPAFRIVVQDGRVKLDHLFLAELMMRDNAPDDAVGLTYRKLIQEAEKANIDTELCLNAG